MTWLSAARWSQRWIFAVILGTFPAAAASAQQSHLDMRRQIEQLAATFSERYNKQDAGALANMFTKDAVRVTSGNSAPSVQSAPGREQCTL